MAPRALALLARAAGSRALLLDVAAGTARCLQEVLSRHDLVKGSFKLEPREGAAEGERTPFEIRVRGARASERARGRRRCARPRALAHAPTPPSPSPPAPAQITGPDDATEYRDGPDATGAKFSFTAAAGGSHKVCFVNASPHARRVALEWAAGAAATDYAELAKKESLKPLELELRKLEDRLAAVQREMQYQREREESHRDLSEVTNSRVVLFSWLTIALVVVQGLLQVWHLYTFFKRGKFID
jgi:hypothetical protein